MNRLLLFFFIFLFSGNAYCQKRVIHVLVALCDNENQGIVPVPAKIGNGRDPGNNLYWGCAYGVKTFMKKQPGWKLLRQVNDPGGAVLERLIFKYVNADVYMVADAYDGAKIKETTIDLLNYSAGLDQQTIEVDSIELYIGGSSSLICYIGHNGLMDFKLSSYPVGIYDNKRDVAVFACASKQYFTTPLKQTRVNPLILTTNLMSPEAYSLAAMVDAWIKKENKVIIKEKVAQAYNKYQKCGISGARRLFSTSWQ